MSKPPISSRVSIRTVLLLSLVVLGGSGLVASLQQTVGSWNGYRQSRMFAERGSIVVQLLIAGKHITDERSRTSVMLRSTGPVSAADRAFVEEHRRLADAALEAVLGKADVMPRTMYAGIFEQRNELAKLRRQVDHDIGLPLASRDKGLAEQWFAVASRFVGDIRHSAERLVGDNRPGDQTTRLTLLAAATLQQRLVTGSEAAAIAQALASGKSPAVQTLNSIHKMRGQEEQLWYDIERLAAAAGIKAIQDKVGEIRQNHLADFRPLQDRVLAELDAHRGNTIPLAQLASASLPLLEGLSTLMMSISEQAALLGGKAESEARARLLEHSAWSVTLLFLLLLSLRYVIRNVVEPLEQMDSELRRLGTLPDDKESGSELERLKASVEALEHSFDARAEAQRIAHLGSWELDHLTHVLTWSDESYRIFEMEPRQFGGTYKAFLDAIHPDDRDRVHSAFTSSVGNHLPYEIEHRLIFPDGRIKYVYEHCETSYAADGKALRSIGTVQDITELKEIENALRESRQSLTEAQRIAHVGSWDLDLVSNKLTWSDESQRIFEIDPQQVSVNYEVFLNTIHPEDRDTVNRVYLASLENRTPYEIVHRLLFSDGRIKYVHEHCETFYSADGKPLRSIGTTQDITERMEIENALHESRQLLTEAQRIAQVGSWEYDIASDTHTWSDELFRIYEIDPVKEGASYEGCLNATHPDDRDAIARAYLNSVETGKPYESEHRLLMADGRIKYVHERCEMVCAPNGTLLRAVGMMQDITERKQAEQKLKEALEFTEGVINAIPDILFEVDREGRYLNVWTQNPELLAAQKEQLLGKTVAEVLSPENATAAMEAIREADEKGYAQGLDIAIDLPGGRRWFSHTLSKKPGGAPGEATFLSLSRDITERKQLEEALAAREQEFRSLAESSPDFIVRYDREGRHRYLNNNLMRKLGLSDLEEVLGKRPCEVWRDGRFYEIEKAAAQAIESGEMQGLEMSAPDDSGGVRYTMLSVVPERDAGGNIIGAIAFGRDITERKRMEAALQESEARYRYHFNQLQSMLESSSSVSVFALDREYRYLFFNNRHREGAKRIRGTDIAIGMNMLESIPDDEFRKFCRKGFDRVLAGHSVSVESKEELVRDGIRSYEYNDNYGSPIFNDKGDVVGLTVFAINTTERKRLEAELRDSRNFLNSVIDSVPDPIFVKDRQHRWILLNDANCRFTGMSREALIGKSDYDIFPKEQADVFWEKDEAVFDSGEVNLNEERFTSADGGEHHIQTKKSLFTSADGQQMLVGVIRDITELKRYEIAREAALAEAERLGHLRSEFLAHVSHELRTPLNGIIGYSQLLVRDKSLSERQLNSVNVIRESGEHLLTLVNDILDFTKIDASKMSIDPNNIELGSFLNAIAGVVRVKADEKHLEFASIIAPDLPAWVCVDEKRLRQVLLNLLSNAVKFTRRGTVSLRVSREASGRLRFEVKDAGIGIAADQLEAIFRPFEQVGEHRYRYGGTGLGLPISRQLVRLMGSDIHVDSRLGQGSTFWFELDVQCGVAAAVGVAQERDAAGGADTPKVALVVPPATEIDALHYLAQSGNMHDILQLADRLIATDERYRPFAERLRGMALGYQTKAMLAFVEQYWEGKTDA